ncbi:hypothetical protein F2Q69_00022793 [Brassica cretica]|uniref:Uncharacterized protein n=1 Tax=Brassica cretica TaxID=69181 RepID=A0A8S9Q6U0_BRACR|nr:hypothetical protein F2Q69_00022793 [Brassica cretica]
MDLTTTNLDSKDLWHAHGCPSSCRLIPQNSTLTTVPCLLAQLPAHIHLTPFCHAFFILDDEDIKSSSEKEKGTKSKSLENMKPRRAKKANQDICAIKTPYLTNQEEFIHETDFSGYYTQQEHANN